MKKYIVLSALVAVAFSSCVREELEPVNSSRKGISISFEGDFAASTKVSFGDASNGVMDLTGPRAMLSESYHILRKRLSTIMSGQSSTMIMRESLMEYSSR